MENVLIHLIIVNFLHDVHGTLSAASSTIPSSKQINKTTTCDKTCQTLPQRYIQEKRNDNIMYRSCFLKEQLTTAVTHISNGNLKMAVKALLNHQNNYLRQKAIHGISCAIKEECIGYAKKQGTYIKNKLENMENFNAQLLTQELKHESPLLWTILSAAASDKETEENDIRITAAASIVYKTRNHLLNSLQHSTGISMYNNQLQKDGFIILSKLGFTNSYSTANKDIHALKTIAEKEMINMKKEVEENNKTEKSDINDHSYSKSIISIKHDDDHTYVQKPYICTPLEHSLNSGYRFNLDNLDFHLKVRDMTQDHQNSSKHYVQMMAIKDRVNCEVFPDGVPIGDLRDVPNSEFLPTAEESVSMRQDIVKITADILCSHLDCFKDFQGIIVSKFHHKYSDEMKKKSHVVPLGILPLNENKTSEMIEILKTLHKYVPGSRSEEEINCEDERDDSCAGMRAIPVGGDQLTVERIRSAHLSRFDGDTPKERLEGVIAMVEDFHEKMNFLQVIMDRYYVTKSSRERGTLYQLRNIINRRNVVSDVSKGYHATAAFIDLVTECHIITADLEHLNMESPSSECKSLPQNISDLDSESRKAIILQICTAIVDKYFLYDVSKSLNKIETEDQSTSSSEDKVFNYASNLTKLGIIRKVAVKSTRYGDGMRLVRHWKYAGLVYHIAKKTKYRLESFLILAGINALYTPRQREQIVHNRFVNLSGGEGKNLDGDYVMELLNRYAKSRVKLLGPNHSPEIVDRIGKTMMVCHRIQENLEKSLKIPPTSSSHTKQSLDKDRLTIIKALKDGQVFRNGICMGKR